MTFANESTKTVTAVQFAFASIGPTARPFGPPLVLDTRENIDAGAIRNEPDAYCKTYGYGAVKSRRLVGWVNAVINADGSSWHAVPPVIGRAMNPSTSPVRLSHSVIYLPLEECTKIQNISDKSINHVRLIFGHADVAGSELGEDVLDVKSTLMPETAVWNNCRKFNGTSVPDLFHYGYALSRGTRVAPPSIAYQGKSSNLSVYASEVDFSDGTSWHVPSR